MTTTVSHSVPVSARAREALDQAATMWPQLNVSADAFCHRFDSLFATGAGDAMRIEVGDLYLAVACLAGDRRAHETLHHMLWSQRQRFRHFRLNDGELDDAISEVFARLLTGSGGAPKLLLYSGRGKLEGWLHVLLTRHLLDSVRAARRRLPTDAEVLLGMSDERDVEVESLKRRYGTTFGEAFRMAIAKLSARQRNVLRQHYLDDLSLEDLGRLYRVHRATAARWLKEAREDVLSLVRAELLESAGLRESEVDTLMNLMKSRLDLSAGYFLSTTTEKAQPGSSAA